MSTYPNPNPTDASFDEKAFNDASHCKTNDVNAQIQQIFSIFSIRTKLRERSQWRGLLQRL